VADEWVIEQVLTAVEQVPPGRVVAYGDLAAIVGTSARRVGAIMRSHGSFVAWWRVTNSYGDLPAHLRGRAFQHWAAEGIAVKPNRLGCRIDAHRVDLDVLRVDLAAALEERTAPAQE
jgi:methylated-DNA-protein-cysteine methyltransferase-like protein